VEQSWLATGWTGATRWGYRGSPGPDWRKGTPRRTSARTGSSSVPGYPAAAPVARRFRHPVRSAARPSKSPGATPGICAAKSVGLGPAKPGLVKTGPRE